MDFSNQDKIIVTGASSGIGQALTWKLNENGATVIAIARSIERLQETKNKAKYSKNIFCEQKNLLEDIEELPNYVKSLKEKYGKFKALACIAGIDKVATLNMLNKKDIDDVFAINYTVPMMLARGFADKRSNTGEGANILFLASISGVYPDKGQIIYGASKAALIAATIAISKEISARKLRCNSISPAYVNTPMFRWQKDNLAVNTKNYVFGIAEPSDIANMASFLISDKAKWITGQNYIMDGGSY